MRSNVRAHSWKAKVCFCDGKPRQPVDGTNGSELKLQFACNFAFSLRTFAENHLPSSILGSSVWWFPLLIQSLTCFSSSSLFPLNFNALHFNHRFNWPTVYSSGSLSNLWNVVFAGENRKRWKRTARHSHIPLTTMITELAFVCVTHDRGLKFRDVISALRLTKQNLSRKTKFRLEYTFFYYSPTFSRSYLSWLAF